MLCVGVKRRARRVILRIALTATALAIATVSAQSSDRAQLISQAVMEHERVVAARADVEAARQRARASVGAWMPQLNTIANYGHEKQVKPFPNDPTNTPFTEVDLKISQLLWDFGASNAVIEKSRLQYVRAQMALFQTVQDVTLEAISAIINVGRTNQIVKFAQQSEANVRRQTGLEQARVDAGGGLSTDVLQAKTQLAGAQARLYQAEGSAVQAVNRFRTFFGTVPQNLPQISGKEWRNWPLPPTLPQALATAYERNPRLRIASMDEAIAIQTEREVAGRELAPRIAAVGEKKFLNNVDGNLGHQRNTLVKIELTFPFNLGFTSLNTLRASQSDIVAASNRFNDARRVVEETVRNAWQQYETARLMARALRDQATLAEGFLRLAREERQLGRRSLIDVLSGETALYNALADAASKEADVRIAALTLLYAIGQLAPAEVSDLPLTGQ